MESNPQERAEWLLPLDVPLAQETHERLSSSTDFYVSSAAATYGTLIQDIVTGEAPGYMLEPRLHEEWDEAHLGLFMFGVQNNDAMVTTNALKLMKRPSYKWYAAAWAAKQGYHQLSPEWNEELGQAEAMAFESDSREAFEICLAKLDLELYKATQNSTFGVENGPTIHTLTGDIKNILKDTETFTYQSEHDEQCLKVARIFRRYGEYRDAKYWRAGVEEANKYALKTYDAQTKPYRASHSGRNLLRLVTGRKKLSDPASHRAGLIEPMRKVDDFLWAKDPTSAIAANPHIGQVGVNSENDHLISSLDVLLRGGAYGRAQVCFNKLFDRDIRRGGFPECHRGVQIQAAALMAREDMSGYSQKMAESTQGRIEALKNTVESAYYNHPERGAHNIEKRSLFMEVLDSAQQIGDCTARAQLLAELYNCPAGQAVMDRSSETKKRINEALVATCHQWSQQLPNDPRLEMFLIDTSKSNEMLHGRLRKYVQRGEDCGWGYTRNQFLGPITMRRLLSRVEEQRQLSE